LLIAAAFQAARPHYYLFPALIIVIAMIGLLFLSARLSTILLSVVYLVLGAVGTFWVVVFLYETNPNAPRSDAFPISFLAIALVMVGGPAFGLTGRVIWCTAGCLAGQLAIAAAEYLSGHAVRPDVSTFVAYGMAVAIFTLVSLSHRNSWRSQPMLHRAAVEEQLAAMRYRIEVKAAALMHDSVLSHLAAIAGSAGAELNSALRIEIQRDLVFLAGEDWLIEGPFEASTGPDVALPNNPLYAAIRETQLTGLEVECSGDLNAVCALSTESSVALGLAVRQCLVNVLRHSGVNKAEVAVFGSGSEVSVMVIDAGRGFSESEAAADRLGLKQSVRGRMEAVGGSVQVWSTPGRGTSIMIRVPMHESLAAASTETD
jgi:signal transduction histidine kinase